MLNFSPDHLDRHPDIESYGAAKARIFENQTADDWAVINADDPAVLELARKGRARQRLFARTDADRAGHGGRRRLDCRSPRGQTGATRSAGAARRDPPARTAPGERRHGRGHGRRHRGRRARGPDRGGRVVSRPRARDGAGGRDRRRPVRQRLEGHQRRGGAPIRSRASRPGWCRSWAAGSRAATFACCANRSRRARRPSSPSAKRARCCARRSKVPWTCARRRRSTSAIELAYALAKPAGVVLLAPACASFDQFRDYAERGRKFKEGVLKLT